MFNPHPGLSYHTKRDGDSNDIIHLFPADRRDTRPGSNRRRAPLRDPPRRALHGKPRAAAAGRASASRGRERPCGHRQTPLPLPPGPHAPPLTTRWCRRACRRRGRRPPTARRANGHGRHDRCVVAGPPRSQRGLGDRGPRARFRAEEERGGRERWWGRAGRTAAFDPVLFEPPFSGLPPTPLSFLFGRFAANSFRRSPPPRPPLPLPPPSPLPRPLPLPPPSGLAAPVAASPSFSSSASRSSAWRRCGRQTSTALDKARHWRARVIPTASDPTLQRADGATRRARGGAHLVIQLLLGVAAARPAALLDAKPLARRQLDVGRSWSSVVVAHVVVDGVALVEEGPLALRACR